MKLTNLANRPFFRVILFGLLLVLSPCRVKASVQELAGAKTETSLQKSKALRLPQLVCSFTAAKAQKISLPTFPDAVAAIFFSYFFFSFFSARKPVAIGYKQQRPTGLRVPFYILFKRWKYKTALPVFSVAVNPF